MNKKQVINILKTMNEDFEMEELINKLLFVRNVDHGLKDVQKNKVSDYDQVKQRFRYDN